VTRFLLLVIAVGLGITSDFALRAQVRTPAAGPSVVAAVRLTPTRHPALPAEAAQYWLVPDRATRVFASNDVGLGRFARGVRLVEEGQFAAGLPLVRDADLKASALAAYAQYYTAVALDGLGRHGDADVALTGLAGRPFEGYLSEAALLRRADIAMANGEPAGAVTMLEGLGNRKLSAPQDVFLRLGRAAESAGDRERALAAYRRVYYEFSLSEEAIEAQAGIGRLQTTASIPADRFPLELARAERLFGAKRWVEAREAFVSLGQGGGAIDRDTIALRIAESDFHRARHLAARNALRPYLSAGPREAEARFYHLSATRALGDTATYVKLARGLVAEHPGSEWAPETLDGLASHYLRIDQDEDAIAVFRELYRRYPTSRPAERAAWKAGWSSYRQGDFAAAATLFEDAAAGFPRGDFRPAWLYWAGRARDRMGDRATANPRYRLVVADYQNTYYGRLASAILAKRREPTVQPTLMVERGATATATSVPNAAVIRGLASLGLYAEALREVQYAQRLWGDSSVLLATSAWIRHEQGLELRATDRFNALRGAINTMRRAYPQFMAAGGEALPSDVLGVIFPIDHWPLIEKYADAQRIDPYLLTALMAQESTFTVEIRSHANAYGLMQLIPGTAHRVARQLGIRQFSTASLTNADMNVRLGTKYFKDLLVRFGGAHYALAGYNAGEGRVARWLQETPELPEDEFIDNIPFPETQNYVKRILGTAEDYRRLYGGGVLTVASRQPSPTRRTD
jgi:soluble lytic murein transglycosylase